MNSTSLNLYSTSSRAKSIDTPSTLFFISAIIVNYLAYENAESILFSLLVIVFGGVITFFFCSKDFSELKIYSRVAIVGFLISGITAYCGMHLDDEMMNFSDAEMFYELSSGKVGRMDANLLRTVSDGAGAILVWQNVYQVAEYLGFEIGRFVGISVNILIVALTSSVALKVSRLSFGVDYRRERQLGWMFTLCGIFWVFQGYHLRDGWIMLVLSILIFYWTKYLTLGTTQNLFVLIFYNLLASFCLYYLRDEFTFVPLGMLVAAVFAMLFCGESSLAKKQTAAFVGLLGICLSAILAISFRDTIFSTAEIGNSGYKDLALASSEQQSLGVNLIIDQVLPLRILLGSVYLLVFPIPVWICFDTESPYFFFKSLNAIFLYFLIPLFVLAISLVYSHKSFRKQVVLFQFFVFAEFLIAIAGTSLESRHIGSFFVPLFVFSLLPNLNDKIVLSKYLKYASRYLIFIVVIHAMWFVIKYI